VNFRQVVVGGLNTKFESMVESPSKDLDVILAHLH
jgi:hypothetical protein